MSAFLIGPFYQAQSISIFGFVEQNVSVQFTRRQSAEAVVQIGMPRDRFYGDSFVKPFLSTVFTVFHGGPGCC
jgi:hypothetical protein